MSSHIADEVSTRMDWSAFTTVGIMMPPRDPDEEDEDDENEARGRSGAGRRLSTSGTLERWRPLKQVG